MASIADGATGILGGQGTLVMHVLTQEVGIERDGILRTAERGLVAIAGIEIQSRYGHHFQSGTQGMEHGLGLGMIQIILEREQAVVAHLERRTKAGMQRSVVILPTLGERRCIAIAERVGSCPHGAGIAGIDRIERRRMDSGTEAEPSAGTVDQSERAPYPKSAEHEAVDILQLVVFAFGVLGSEQFGIVHIGRKAIGIHA